MNYYEYIDILEPSNDTKEKLKSKVKSSLIAEQKRKSQRNIKFIGLVACFAVFVGVFSIIKNTPQKTVVTNDSSTSTTNSNINNTIIISESNDKKSLPQEIILNGVFYRQFCSPNLKEQLKTDNNNIIINYSEIGNHICKLNEKNIYNTDIERLESISEVKTNEFYNADVYEYKSYTDNSIIIVKTSDKYYFFHAFNLEKNIGFEKIKELYSLDSNNKIKSIEVWQDEIVEESIIGFDGEEVKGTTSKDILVKTINDNKKIEKFLKLLELSKPAQYTDSDDIYNYIHQTKLNESMKETDEYRLVINLSNGSSFNMWICSNSEYVEVLESTYYQFNNNEMKTIIKIIKDN